MRCAYSLLRSRFFGGAFLPGVRAGLFCNWLFRGAFARGALALLRNGKRTAGPRGKLIGIVVEPLRQAPKMPRWPADMMLGQGINKRSAALAFETWNAGFIHPEIDHAVEDKAKHEAIGVEPDAAEHPLGGHGTKRREQFADEVGVHARNPPQGFSVCSALRLNPGSQALGRHRPLFRPDIGRLDDRPPFLDLGALQRRKRLRRLLVARSDLEPEIGKPPANGPIRERADRCRIELGENVARQPLRTVQP